MHLLQSPVWGKFKSQFGWLARTVILADGQKPVQVLYRRLPLGLKIAYIPKGPDVDWPDTAATQKTLTRLKELAAQPATLFLKVEPDAVDDPQIVQAFLGAGFRPGKAIQPINTIIVDIAPSEEAILAQMKSKTRYNIRLAQRKGVIVRRGTASDLAPFYELNRVTATRDRFAIHSPAYYRGAFDHFADDHCALLMAEYGDQLLAGLMVFAWQERAYYLYGASNNRHRNRMPTYLLQWEAIRWAKAKGCRTYDLWGIPDVPLETLEANFMDRRGGLWGVYRFKRGFGGEVARSVGAFDYVDQAHFHKRILHAVLLRFV